MTTVSFVSELAASIQQGRHSLFLGAGSSVCCGIPSGGGVVKQLQAKHGKNIGASYHEVMQNAFRSKANRRNFFESLCAGKSPCRHHYQIAELADRGIFNIIYTTNFDRLIEIALMSYCSTQPSVYLNDEEFGEVDVRGKHPKVLKLHGDFLLQAIANVPTELRQALNADMRQKLRSQLVGKGLIVVGYGGGDNTVMSALGEVLNVKGCLQDGLWWVDCVAPSDLSESVTKLLARARDAGKQGHYIRCNADELFDSLCREISVDVCLPHFALRGDRSAPPWVGSMPMFGYARHQLAQAIPRCGDWTGHTASRSSENVLQAMEHAPTVWLVGPWPDTRNVVSDALRRCRRPAFYFDYRFARNQPAANDLLNHIARFAAGYRITMAGRHYEHAVQALFQKRAILVFSNVSEADPIFWKKLSWVIAIQRRIAKGNVLLVDRNAPAGAFLECVRRAFFETVEPENDTVMACNAACVNLGGMRIIVGGTPAPADIGMQVVHLQAYRSKPNRKRAMTRAEHKLLGLMSLLRFAESCQIIATLAGVERSRTRKLIDHLEQMGYLEKQGGRFCIIEAVTMDSQAAQAAIQIDLATRFKQLARNASRKNDLNGFHYMLEAEYHYFAGGRYVEAAELLAECIEPLLRVSSNLPEIATWTAHTLLDLFRLEVAGKRVLSALSERQLLSLVLGLYDACLISDVRAGDNVLSVWSSLLESLGGEPMTCYARGYHYRRSGKYELAINAFEEAARGLVGPSWQLALAQSSIADCHYSLTYVPGHLEQGERWTRAARSTFRALKEKHEEAKALGNLCFCCLSQRRWPRALSLARQTIRILQERPGFSRDKGVAYGNAARALLALSRPQEAEGFFLESALHYANTGELEGLTKLYAGLFAERAKLPSDWGLTAAHLYTAAMAAWTYSRPYGAFPMMLLVNQQYLEEVFREHQASAAARAINDIGCLGLDGMSEDRLELSLPWMRRFFDNFCDVDYESMRTLLRRSRWWKPEEKRCLLAVLHTRKK